MENNPMNNVNNKRPVRVKNELKFREIIVKRCEDLFGCFKRIIFTGEELGGFVSRGFDDHIKVFFPSAPGKSVTPPRITEEGIVWPEGARPIGRDYTPLSFNAEKNELTLDFYLHDGGVASEWAAKAKPGDMLAMGGPRGSLLIPTDYARQLYLCDETGLPAIKRRCGELNAAGTAGNAVILASARDARCREYLADHNDMHIQWVIAGAPGRRPDNDAVLASVKALPLSGKDCFIWATGEGGLVKAIGDFFTVQCGVEPDFVRAVAYWHDK